MSCQRASGAPVVTGHSDNSPCRAFGATGQIWDRHRIATSTGESENYLWPEALTPERKAEAAAVEVVNVFPHRNNVPVELWDRLIADATQTIEILVHAGLFLVERPRFIKDLARLG